MHHTNTMVYDNAVAQASLSGLTIVPLLQTFFNVYFYKNMITNIRDYCNNKKGEVFFLFTVHVMRPS